ncbi:MAG: molybdopterin cofactor-binding domain-containing protein, partial [Pseudomonadota bacterium]
MNRRNLLKVSALAGGGLMLQMTLPKEAVAAEHNTLIRNRELNVYVQIAPDGEITIYSAIPEMGQGIKTTLPMIIAEEMGARWEDVTVITAPLDQQTFGMQGAGGSTSVPRNIGTMRRMGASAREMLIGAAALLMEVDREELEARDSQVVHSSGQARTFGQLAALAAEQPVPDPEMLSFKDPRSYTIIGTSVGGVDNLVIATGRTEFGIDVDVPGMKYASYQRCPTIGGRARTFNEREIRALPGVTDAFILDPDPRSGEASMAFLRGLAELQGGVAIVGDDTWSVFNAKSKLEVDWDTSGASEDDWERMVEQGRALAREDGGEVKAPGINVAEALADDANKQTEAFYQFPYVAHICMEPMNCTADFR